MSSVIFLDIDGVLNNTPWMSKSGFGTLDPANVLMLDRLVQLTDAVLVISSDWRCYHSYKALCRNLCDQGVPNRFLGITPVLEAESGNRGILPRGLEIDTWLQTNRWMGSFVILDDRSDMEPHMDRLVQTDHNRGLVETDVQKAVTILQNGPN